MIITEEDVERYCGKECPSNSYKELPCKILHSGESCPLLTLMQIKQGIFDWSNKE